VKRATKNSKRAKVPRRFIPIVDAVVEGVFARLSEAAAQAKHPKRPKSASRAEEPTEPDSGRGLAGAIADHLLAALSREASKPKKSKRRARRRSAGR
jgi:hypothetical protein